MCSIEWLCCRRPWVTPNPQTSQICAIFVTFYIFIMGQHRDFIFVTQRDNLVVASPSPPMTNHPWKRVGYGHVTLLNSHPPKISREWLQLETSNFVYCIAMWWYSIGITNCPLSGHSPGHVMSLNFGKWAIISRERCKVRRNYMEDK